MLRLRDIMTSDVVTVTPETTLRDAMELFSRHHISGAPVMAGTKVLGLISATDILEFASTASRATAQPAPPEIPDEWPDEENPDTAEATAAGCMADHWRRRGSAGGEAGTSVPEPPR